MEVVNITRSGKPVTLASIYNWAVIVDKDTLQNQFDQSVQVILDLTINPL